MQLRGINVVVIVVPNFIKISETIAEISHLKFFFDGGVKVSLAWHEKGDCTFVAFGGKE